MLSHIKRLSVVAAGLIVLLALVASIAYGLGMRPYKVYIVHTGSMAPTIPSRSIAIVRTGKYHVGQVISFTVDGQTITHRLLGFGQDGLTITKGDADQAVDPWHVPKRNIVGGVVLAPKGVGWPVMYVVGTKTGALSIAFFVLTIWLCLIFPEHSDESQETTKNDELAAV